MSSYFYIFFPPHFKSVSYNQHLPVLLFVFWRESACMKGAAPLLDPFCVMCWRSGDLESSLSDLTPYHLWESHLTSVNLSIFICKTGIKPSTKFLVVLKGDNIQGIPLETKMVLHHCKLLLSLQIHQPLRISCKTLNLLKIAWKFRISWILQKQFSTCANY